MSKAFQRFQRHGAQRHDHFGIYDLNCAAEEIGAVNQFCFAGPAIGTGFCPGIAQSRTGDEDLPAIQAYRGEKAVEILAGLVT